ALGHGGLKWAFAAGGGFTGGSGLRAAAGTGSSSRGTNIGDLPGRPIPPARRPARAPTPPANARSCGPENPRTHLSRDRQAIKADGPPVVGERQVGLDKKRRAVHMQRVVDGNRASRR